MLLFRYFEAQAEIKQAISVFKKRTGAHKRTIHVLVINSNGIQVGAPLRGFIGIMTGVPEYRGGLKMAAANAEVALPQGPKKMPK